MHITGATTDPAGPTEQDDNDNLTVALIKHGEVFLARGKTSSKERGLEAWEKLLDEVAAAQNKLKADLEKQIDHLREGPWHWCG